MNKVFYSILIPVYNVEKYIEECLNSVIYQTYTNFEVIILIDGSTDTSALICEKFALRDKRLEVFYQKNMGLLQTRRNLLSKAKGEYILFIDSDDFWELNLLETINQILTKNNYDLILFRFNRVTDKGRVYSSDMHLFNGDTIFTKENKYLVWEKFISSNRLNHIWSKVIKREIVDDEDYALYSNVYGEDILISLPLIYKARTIFYLDKALYNYRMSTIGLGRNFSIDFIDDTESVRKEVLRYLNKSNLITHNNLVLFYTAYLKSIIRQIRLLIGSYKMDENIIFKLNTIKESELFTNSLKYSHKDKLSLLEKLYYYLLLNNYYNMLNHIIKIDFGIKNWLKSIVRQ